MARHFARMTVEQSRSINVLEWHRLGYLRCRGRFSWRWTRLHQRIAFLIAEAGRKAVALKYFRETSEGSHPEFQQSLAVDWTPCRFGGERPWFLCDCGRRVVALYAGPGGFACRSCHGLSYQSQRVTDCERTASKARKIRFRLDGSASLVEPFPARPKGMHRKRYARLWQDYQQAAARAYSAFDLSIRRLARKIGN